MRPWIATVLVLLAFVAGLLGVAGVALATYWFGPVVPFLLMIGGVLCLFSALCTAYDKQCAAARRAAARRPTARG
jgi:hypothetical protein